MAMRPWKALVLLLALGLAGCGNGDEEGAASSDSEAPAADTAQQAPAETTSSPDQGQGEPEALSADAPTTATDEGASEDTMADGATTDSATTDAMAGTAAGEPASRDGAQLEPGSETLEESPADTLEEGEALPGEATRSDVDAIIEETERRFQEASKKIDEQFEQAEQEAPELEPMPGPDGSSELEEALEPAPDVPSLPSDAAVGDEVSESDVDAIIEETERRFQEASKKIDEQFRQAEQQAPEQLDEQTSPGEDASAADEATP